MTEYFDYLDRFWEQGMLLTSMYPALLQQKFSISSSQAVNVLVAWQRQRMEKEASK